MKITKSHLKEIIKEELEEAAPPPWALGKHNPPPGKEAASWIRHWKENPPEPSVAPEPERTTPTNMNDDLRDFAQWVLKVDGHIESLSGQHMTAAEVPSDINLYDLWLTGASPDGAAHDLMRGDTS